jgi:hypothetical protein
MDFQNNAINLNRGNNEKSNELDLVEQVERFLLQGEPIGKFELETFLSTCVQNLWNNILLCEVESERKVFVEFFVKGYQLGSFQESLTKFWIDLIKNDGEYKRRKGTVIPDEVLEVLIDILWDLCSEKSSKSSTFSLLTLFYQFCSFKTIVNRSLLIEKQGFELIGKLLEIHCCEDNYIPFTGYHPLCTLCKSVFDIHKHYMLSTEEVHKLINSPIFKLSPACNEKAVDLKQTVYIFVTKIFFTVLLRFGNEKQVSEFLSDPEGCVQQALNLMQKGTTLTTAKFVLSSLTTEVCAAYRRGINEWIIKGAFVSEVVEPLMEICAMDEDLQSFFQTNIQTPMVWKGFDFRKEVRNHKVLCLRRCWKNVKSNSRIPEVFQSERMINDSLNLLFELDEDLNRFKSFHLIQK